MSNNSVVIAIDPGAAGGIAIHAGQKVFAANLNETDTWSWMIELVRSRMDERPVAYMEQVGGYIGKEQPGSAMFNFGDVYGFWRGTLKTLSVPLTLVPPQTWMRAVAPGVIGMERDRRKRALLELAHHWYPELGLDEMSKTAGLKLADALCILRYALGKGAGDASPSAALGRSRDSFPADARGFKRYCKAIGQGVPKGQEFMQALNWWVEQGRPAK